jgi:hypothetical protein
MPKRASSAVARPIIIISPQAPSRPSGHCSGWRARDGDYPAKGPWWGRTACEQATQFAVLPPLWGFAWWAARRFTPSSDGRKRGWGRKSFSAWEFGSLTISVVPRKGARHLSNPYGEPPGYLLEGALRAPRGQMCTATSRQAIEEGYRECCSVPVREKA